MGADIQMLFDALSSGVRREILWLTWAEELSVSEIGAHFELSGPTLSSHLAVLRDAGLVSMRVDGNFRRYRCNRDAVRALVPVLASSDERWVVADATPERELAAAGQSRAVTVQVEVPVDQGTAFRAFTDDEVYSGWLGVPVSIEGRRFRATLEWGTQVRGHYEVVSPPDLIAMRWDFEDDAVPVPGHELVAYLRVHPTDAGSLVEVHQLAEDDRQASFLADAWALVLGRLAQACAGGTVTAARRAPRPKRGGRGRGDATG